MLMFNFASNGLLNAIKGRCKRKGVLQRNGMVNKNRNRRAKTKHIESMKQIYGAEKRIRESFEHKRKQKSREKKLYCGSFEDFLIFLMGRISLTGGVWRK
uniref:Uncharacterized protein n=1 Tax=Cacopsylla melanoneura TaxID=428564 RepID=A0A8D9FKI7_9HEMI